MKYMVSGARRCQPGCELPLQARAKEGRGSLMVLGSPALLLNSWVILGNNSASLSLSSSVQWSSQPGQPQKAAVKMRQSDVGKEPDMEGVTRAQRLLLVACVVMPSGPG